MQRTPRVGRYRPYLVIGSGELGRLVAVFTRAPCDNPSSQRARRRLDHDTNDIVTAAVKAMASDILARPGPTRTIFMCGLHEPRGW
jgi:hypothetical protein